MLFAKFLPSMQSIKDNFVISALRQIYTGTKITEFSF